MTTPVHCVLPQDDVAHARREMIRRDVSHLPVVDEEGGLRGVLSLADLVFVEALRGGGAPRPERRPSQVGAVMTRDVATAFPAMSAEDAGRLLVGQGVSCAPVLRGGAVVGIVAVSDVLRALAPDVPGTFQVRSVMRAELPRVSRHASPSAVLKVMKQHGVREVAVTEGQTFITDRAPPSHEALRDPLHQGRTAASWGIVGLVDLKSIASSAWFERNVTRGGGGKRLHEARRTEPAGAKRLRHVERVEAVAEDMMTRDVRAVAPDDDAATAVRMFVDGQLRGVPVLGDGAKPGYLDRADLLAAVLRHLPAGRAAEGAPAPA